jgi:hypothetical protein
MKAATVKEVLIAAHWILTHYDWCKGALWRDTNRNLIWRQEDISNNKKLGACCLSGAVQLVETPEAYTGKGSLTWQTLDTISTAIRQVIPEWNDAPNRSKQEVLDLLDKLIAEA